MDFSESMKIVFQRIQKLDQENAPRIIGYLLLQNFGEQEMIRLAFSPDNMIQCLINKAKIDLEIPLINPTMFSINTLPPTNLIPFIPISSSPPSFQFHNTPFDPPFAMTINQTLIHTYENAHHFIPFEPLVNGYFPNQPYLLQCEHHMEFIEHPNDESSPSLPQFCPNISHSSMPICENFSHGYCKYGANCRFLHVLRMENGYMMVLNPPNEMEEVNEDHLSPHERVKQLEIELIELLKSRKGVPVPIACLHILYREKYGRKLFEGFDHEFYLMETNAQGNFCCGLTGVLSQMTNTMHLIDTPHGQPCLILTEDIPRYMKFIEERNNDHENTMISLCQVYLTFPQQSMFSELDVFNYFNHFGPVQDVRIPSQDKRMYGFVTFVFPETVTLVLTQVNPHFICGAQVLVKPYRIKPVLVDRKIEENIHYSAQNNPSSTDVESISLSSENMKCSEKQSIEEHAQAAELEKKPITEIEFANSSNFSKGTTNYGNISEGQIGHIDTCINDNESAEEVDLPDSPFGRELVYGRSSS